MKRYKLKKDLPTFKAGQEFAIAGCDGGLWLIGGYDDHGDWYGRVLAYSRQTLEKFPNILTDWFEEIPETPKTVWDLKEGDGCFYFATDGGIFSDQWEGAGLDHSRRDIGNIFITREEAEKELARRRVKVILERDTKGFKPNWQSGEYDKYEVAYDYSDGGYDGISLFVNDCRYCCSHNDLWFATEEDAQYSIEKHEKEWKIYLGVEE